jgi:uncharacterized protein (TIGR02996 family)
MNDEQGLLKAIAETPNDVLARLAYADFCEEQGRLSRANLLRATAHLIELATSQATLGNFDLHFGRKARLRVCKWEAVAALVTTDAAWLRAIRIWD